jgi:hypothetical protein
MRKEGGRLIVEPIRKGRLLSLLVTLSPLDEPFPDVDENLPPLDEAELGQSCFVICWIRISFPIWFDSHKARWRGELQMRVRRQSARVLLSRQNCASAPRNLALPN